MGNYRRIVEKSLDLVSEDDSDIVSTEVDLKFGEIYSIQLNATDSDSNVDILVSSDGGNNYTQLGSTHVLAEGDGEFINGEVSYTNIKVESTSDDSNPATVAVSILVQGSAS